MIIISILLFIGLLLLLFKFEVLDKWYDCGYLDSVIVKMAVTFTFYGIVMLYVFFCIGVLMQPGSFIMKF